MYWLPPVAVEKEKDPFSFWGCLVFLGLWPHHSCLCFCNFLKQYLFSFLAAPGLSFGVGSLVAVCELSYSTWDLDP